MDIVLEQRRDDNLKQLLEVGNCGLHTVHNGFKHDGKASGWWIDKVLRAMYKIFDQSTFRRGEYESLTRGIYPQQFCSHCWAENQILAERAIDVWDDVKQPKEGNKSCSWSKTAISDPLMKTKFKFFAATENSKQFSGQVPNK